MRESGYPSFYNPSRAGERFDVDYNAVFDAAMEAQASVRLSRHDKIKTCLLPIDMQITFCDPNGQLPVRGAVGDCQRMAEFVYRNVGVITQIIPTLDSHTLFQIFHRLFLVDKDGNPPGPNTPVTNDDILAGRWYVNPDLADAIMDSAGKNLERNRKWLQDYLAHYTGALEKGKKVPLMIWKFHAMIGSISHALMPIVEEAFRYHEVARISPLDIRLKGDDLLREHYSVFQPTVMTTHDGTYQACRDEEFYDTVLSHDMVIVGGEASSHCVGDSLLDLLAECRRLGEGTAGKVYILRDCMSPVVIVPGDKNLDFTPVAEAVLTECHRGGMHVVNSTDPIWTWPGSPFTND